MTSPEAWWGLFDQGFLLGAYNALLVIWVMVDWKKSIQRQIRCIEAGHG